MVQLNIVSFVVAIWASSVAFAHPQVFSRQSGAPFDTSGVPASCSSQCSAVTTPFANDPTCDDDPECACAPAILSAMPSCLSCAATASPDLYKDPDTVVSVYKAFCEAATTGSASASATATATASAGASTSTKASSASGTTGKGTSTSTVSSASATSSPNGSGSTAQNMFAVVGAVAVGAAVLL